MYLAGVSNHVSFVSTTATADHHAPLQATKCNYHGRRAFCNRHQRHWTLYRSAECDYALYDVGQREPKHSTACANESRRDLVRLCFANRASRSRGWRLCTSGSCYLPTPCRFIIYKNR